MEALEIVTIAFRRLYMKRVKLRSRRWVFFFWLLGICKVDAQCGGYVWCSISTYGDYHYTVCCTVLICNHVDSQ